VSEYDDGLKSLVFLIQRNRMGKTALETMYQSKARWLLHSGTRDSDSRLWILRLWEGKIGHDHYLVLPR
jgi:hypothetical protein